MFEIELKEKGKIIAKGKYSIKQIDEIITKLGE